jgi:hypothetical protein
MGLGKEENIFDFNINKIKTILLRVFVALSDDSCPHSLFSFLIHLPKIKKLK